MTNTVFLSYRRDVSRYVALAICYYLRSQEFKVFIDVESLTAGRFGPEILNAIASSFFFIPIFGPKTLEGIDDEQDWFRQEIEFALRLEKEIIPIHHDGFRNDVEGLSFPESIAMITEYQHLLLANDYFREGMDRLCNNFLNHH